MSKPGSSQYLASLLVTSDGSVGTITLNRPEVRNALDRATLSATVDAVAALAADSDVRVIVLTGAGGHFCSGEDLREAGELDEPTFLAHIEHFQEVTRRLRAAPQPVIGSIAGHAQGGGLELALACDIRVCADTARFACPEQRLGLTITNGTSVLLARCVGETWARHMTMLGETIDAERAHQIGLVSRVVPEPELAAATRETAERLVAASPHALNLTKRLLEGDSSELERALSAEVDTVMEAFRGPDAREGLRAFAERRAPDFGGSSA